MADEIANSLREMALHRGLKLVRSRRRKPGTGDFGKFGLTDEKGKPLLGIGDDGLTASVQDIEDYLRAGAANTWQQSAKMTPGGRMPRGERKKPGDAATGKAEPRQGARSAVGRSGHLKQPAVAREQARRASGSGPEAERRDVARMSNAVSRKKTPQNQSTRKAAQKLAPAKSGATEAVEAELPEIEPALVLRSAKPADAGAIARLLAQLDGVSAPEDDVARSFAAMRKAGAGVHVAEFGPIVGLVAWSVVLTLHRGSVGRITAIVVEENHRRRGIGARLLAVAEAVVAKKGCVLIEVMSDVAIKNAHNFFRSLAFDQTSYRFARKIAT